MQRFYAGLLLLFISLTSPIYSQSLGNAATLSGTVVDQTDAVVPNALVHLHNPITRYEKATKTDENGTFRFVNIPQNQYHVEISAKGFENQEQDVNLHGAVPIVIAVKLALAGGKTEMTVEATGTDMLETVSYAHNDIDKTLDRQPACRLARLGLERRDYVWHAWCGGGLQRLFPSAGRPCAGHVFRRRADGQRPAEQAILDAVAIERGPVDAGDYGSASGGVWR